jgi:hypothetical protein
MHAWQPPAPGPARRTVLLVLLGTVSLSLAACTRSPQAAPAPAVQPAASTPAAELADSPVPPPAAAPAAGPGWRTGPLTVVHQPAVPPVPVVLRVRAAAHPEAGYDRLTVDVQGPLPGYTVRYVDKVLADGSGRPVSVPGRRYLLVVFTPAQAHRDDGTPTVAGTHPLHLSNVRGYAVAGDFEGHVSIGVGMDSVTRYRVGELPGRVYLDVAS